MDHNTDFKNRFTNDEAMLVIGSLVDLLEKYETALIEISKSNLPKKLKTLADEAISYGNEIIDGPPED